MSESHFMSSPPLKLFSSSVDFDTDATSSSTGATNSADDQRRERELDRITGTAQAKTMSVPFGTLVRLLAAAVEDECTWLEDFSEDTVQIDADLHEVMLAYQNLRQRRAA